MGEKAKIAVLMREISDRRAADFGPPWRGDGVGNDYLQVSGVRCQVSTTEIEPLDGSCP